MTEIPEGLIRVSVGLLTAEMLAAKPGEDEPVVMVEGLDARLLDNGDGTLVLMLTLGEALNLGLELGRKVRGFREGAARSGRLERIARRAAKRGAAVVAAAGECSEQGCHRRVAIIVEGVAYCKRHAEAHGVRAHGKIGG